MLPIGCKSEPYCALILFILHFKFYEGQGAVEGYFQEIANVFGSVENCQDSIKGNLRQYLYLFSPCIFHFSSLSLLL